VEAVLEAKGDPMPPPEGIETRRATLADAPALAELLGETFEHYPTPSNDPEYVAQQLRDGTPFRVVEDGEQIVACASADLLRDARTAELTDCATRPQARGQGLMRRLLADLMDDLRDLGYPTAFTLARARIPGVNVAFSRLGFELRGTMLQSCRIGDGLEDMNVWSRAL
jgi:putative beta-lysine N-acetyltransferase